MFYNPVLTLQQLSYKGALQSVFSTWFTMISKVGRLRSLRLQLLRLGISDAPGRLLVSLLCVPPPLRVAFQVHEKSGKPMHFKRLHDKKICVLGLVSLLSCAPEGMPSEVQAGLPQVMHFFVDLPRPPLRRGISLSTRTLNPKSSIFAGFPWRGAPACEAQGANGAIYRRAYSWDVEEFVPDPSLRSSGEVWFWSLWSFSTHSSLLIRQESKNNGDDEDEDEDDEDGDEVEDNEDHDEDDVDDDEAEEYGPSRASWLDCIRRWPMLRSL
jgi:hypothetical protein